MKARDIMRRRVLTVRPETRLRDLARQLVARDICGTPVVAPQGDLIGMVLQTDLARRPDANSTVASVMTPWIVSFQGRHRYKRDGASDVVKKNSPCGDHA